MPPSAQLAQPPAAPVVRDVQSVPPVPAQPTVPRGEIAALVKRVRLAQQRTAQRRRARARTFASLNSAVQGSPWYTTAGAVTLAVIAELLSLISVGWLISWLIPVVTWYMVKQTNGINGAGDRIIDERGRLIQEIRVAQQRLRPALVKGRQSSLLATPTPSSTERFGSYIQTFVRDTITVQLVELIPGINAILPLYLGQVLKVIVQQRRLSRQVSETLPAYRQTVDLLDSLERFEVQYAEMQANIVLARVLRESSLPTTS